VLMMNWQTFETFHKGICMFWVRNGRIQIFKTKLLRIQADQTTVERDRSMRWVFINSNLSRMFIKDLVFCSFGLLVAEAF